MKFLDAKNWQGERLFQKRKTLNYELSLIEFNLLEAYRSMIRRGETITAVSQEKSHEAVANKASLSTTIPR